MGGNRLAHVWRHEKSKIRRVGIRLGTKELMGQPKGPAGLLPLGGQSLFFPAPGGQGVAHHSAVVCFPQSLLV